MKEARVDRIDKTKTRRKKEGPEEKSQEQCRVWGMAVYPYWDSNSLRQLALTKLNN
jgi:hypothetical protein